MSRLAAVVFRPVGEVTEGDTPSEDDTNRTATPAIIIIMIPVTAPVIIVFVCATSFPEYANKIKRAPAIKNTARNKIPERAISKFAKRMPVLMISVNEHFPFAVHAGKINRKESGEEADGTAPPRSDGLSAAVLAEPLPDDPDEAGSPVVGVPVEASVPAGVDAPLPSVVAGTGGGGAIYASVQ